MNYNIALLRGDGIGPEIVDSAVEVLKKIGTKYGHTFNFTPYLIGGCAIDATGVPLPQETIDVCLASDSVLLGAVGGKKWDTLPGNLRPEAGLFHLRPLCADPVLRRRHHHHQPAVCRGGGVQLLCFPHCGQAHRQAGL